MNDRLGEVIRRTSKRIERIGVCKWYSSSAKYCGRPALVEGGEWRRSQIRASARIAVWDTCLKKKDGTVMHFDILAPSSQRDTAVIHNYGREYLRTNGQEGQSLSAKECRFCHVGSMRPQWEALIRMQGYFIIEMEGCA